MRKRPAFVYGSVVASLCAGCAIIGGEEFSGGSGAVDAGAPTDAGAGRDGAIDATPYDGGVVEAGGLDSGLGGAIRGPSISNNGDFELGCAGWATDSVTAVASNISHGGAVSCRVCFIAGGTLYQTVDRAVAPGQRYLGEVWIRAAPGSSPGPLSIAMINEFSNGGNEPFVLTASPTPGADWVQLSALLTTKKNGVGVTFLLQATDLNGCYLIDDATLSPLLP